MEFNEIDWEKVADDLYWEECDAIAHNENTRYFITNGSLVELTNINDDEIMVNASDPPVTVVQNYLLLALEASGMCPINFNVANIELSGLTHNKLVEKLRKIFTPA